jgi:8-oxo-dGTP pyrophosphatase MutT (NUDIX family)
VVTASPVSSTVPTWRPTARVIVVDPDERLLLFSATRADGTTWWFTPGGGVHRGETVEAAAVRELAEEIGYACTEAELGPTVATCAGTWASRERRFFAADSFFFLRVPRLAINTDGQEEWERSYITGHRWWTLGEIREASGAVSPHGLADLADQLLRGEAPGRPIRLAWA